MTEWSYLAALSLLLSISTEAEELSPVTEPQMALWEWAHLFLERVTEAGELWLAASELSLWHPTAAGLKGSVEIVAPEAQLQNRSLAAQNSSLTSSCNSSSERRGPWQETSILLTKAEDDFPG